MKVRSFVGVMVVGWCLTPSGSIAGTVPDYMKYPETCAVRTAVAPPAERTELIDERTGAQLRVTARPNGAVQVGMTWTDFDFRKIIQPNGDFTLRLAGGPDTVLVILTGDRLRVTRNGRTAVFRHGEADEPGFEQVQRVIAGSRAMRMFRTLRARLGDDTLASVPGIIVDVTDVQVGVLQGDGGVLERRRPRASGRVQRVASGGQNKCYEEWEFEVNVAWRVFEQCVDEYKWYPGGPDACGFVWTVRVEGAWFKYLACCSFPLKIE
jgi:hypothetical protein